MSDNFDDLKVKLITIMSTWRPSEASRLKQGQFGALNVLTDALMDDRASEAASSIAFHLTDWNWEAAFLVAVHLQPDSFTADEIRTGIDMLLIHAPEHIAEAARLAGYPVDNIFRPDDK